MREITHLISVVIPCYNAERWIAATLRSVLKQDWKPLEIIVVDDGSSDDSASLVEREFPHVVLLRQQNQGVAAARNHGIRMAKGDWIAFLDADDIWLPGKLAAQWVMLQQYPEARMIYTAWHVWPCDVAEPEKELVHSLCSVTNESHWQDASGWIYPELLLDCVVWTSTVLVQRAVLEEVGCFDETLRIGEDYDLWLRMSQHTRILRVPRPLALYRAHPASITRKAPEKNYQAEVIARALNRWGYVSPDGRLASKRSVAKALARSWRGYAGAQIVAGDMTKAWQGIVTSLRLDSTSITGWKLLAKALLSGF